MIGKLWSYTTMIQPARAPRPFPRFAGADPGGREPMTALRRLAAAGLAVAVMSLAGVALPGAA